MARNIIIEKNSLPHLLRCAGCTHTHIHNTHKHTCFSPQHTSCRSFFWDAPHLDWCVQQQRQPRLHEPYLSSTQRNARPRSVDAARRNRRSKCECIPSYECIDPGEQQARVIASPGAAINVAEGGRRESEKSISPCIVLIRNGAMLFYKSWDIVS